MENGFEEGTLTRGEVSLNYRLYGNKSGSKKLLWICGFGATMQGYDELARKLVSNDPEDLICCYDHRNSINIFAAVAKSKAPSARYTSTILAQDGIALLDHLGWKDNVHIYGPSMGGMVAQELALADPKRFASLFLSVTNCGKLIRLAMPTFVYGFMMQKFVLSAPKDQFIKDLVEKVFSKEFLAQEGKREQWVSRYSERFDIDFFWDKESMACLASVSETHYVPYSKMKRIKSSGMRVAVMVCTKDVIIPPASQYELARSLGVEPLVYECGHMGAAEERERFERELQEIVNAANKS